jgi:transcriptional regulator with XRE-family HTH domain
MAVNVQLWRKRNRLTQVDAASLLGVSQPYLSLIEKGERPVTPELRQRLKIVPQPLPKNASDERFRAQLSALEYPGFAHLRSTRAEVSPGALLLAVVSQQNVDSRVVEALPWLVRQYGDQMDFTWLVRQAKLRDLQNRLGFLLQVSGAHTKQVLAAVRELERARLLEESTICWDEMPKAMQEWIRMNRTPLARHWNVLTTLSETEAKGGA